MMNDLRKSLIDNQMHAGGGGYMQQQLPNILSLNRLLLSDQVFGSLHGSASTATLSILGSLTSSSLRGVGGGVGGAGGAGVGSTINDHLDSFLILLDEAFELLPGAKDDNNWGNGGPRSMSNPPLVLQGDRVDSNGDLNFLKKSKTISPRTDSQLQNQLLSALSMPYIDIPRPLVFQRNSNASTTMNYSSSLTHSVSSLNLTILPSPASHGGLNITPVQPMSSKFASNHSVFTTEFKSPYKILSSNDMACLLFGLSQGDLRSRSIFDILEENYDTYVESLVKNMLETNQEKAVFICGHILPIVKSNGIHSLASFWVKSHNGFVSWVLEEVISDKIDIKFSTVDWSLKSLTGDNYKIFAPKLNLPEDEDKLATISIKNLIPGLNYDSLENWNFSFPGYKYHSITANNVKMPCFAKLKSYDDFEGIAEISVTSLPLMAGVVIIDCSSVIVDYNEYFIGTLLGYGRDNNKILRGSLVTSIIPKFNEYLQRIFSAYKLGYDNNPLPIGLVIPEQAFRKVAAVDPSNNEGGPDDPKLYPITEISAVTLQGSSINVDIQLRVISTTHFALWISYSRDIQGLHSEYEIPSQLSLLDDVLEYRANMKKVAGESSAETESSSNSRSSTGGSAAASTTLTPMDSEDSLTTPKAGGISPLTPVTSVVGSIDSTISDSTITSNTSRRRPPVEVGAKRRQKSLKDFNVVQKLGEGAYGKVLLVQYPTEPKDIVVLKCVIKERILVDTWTRDRKLGTIPNEIKIMNNLNALPHENIVTLIDFFEDDLYYHIEMERHGNPGTDLFDLIELKPDMAIPECRSIFQQVASAVLHLHGHGIIHRDIKDENIIVDEKGRIKLIDFGSAALTRQGPFDVFVGTIDYAAPEVLSGMPYEGKPQDVWALGILLYTIMYKENPFYNVDEIMEGDLRLPYIPHESCVNLIQKILERDIRNRPSIQDICEHEWVKAL